MSSSFVRLPSFLSGRASRMQRSRPGARTSPALYHPRLRRTLPFERPLPSLSRHVFQPDGVQSLKCLQYSSPSASKRSSTGTMFRAWPAARLDARQEGQMVGMVGSDLYKALICCFKAGKTGMFGGLEARFWGRNRASNAGQAAGHCSMPVICSWSVPRNSTATLPTGSIRSICSLRQG